VAAAASAILHSGIISISIKPNYANSNLLAKLHKLRTNELEVNIKVRQAEKASARRKKLAVIC
jgi:hypothetical protein